MELSGKKIILSVSGSIAAYKAVLLLRLLVKEGAEVQVLMTPTAKEFITPVTLSALSGKSVLSDFFKETGGEWNSHVDMGVEADLMIVAPATATTMGKMANGIADNLVITTYLSARCTVIIAPAMDYDMFAHPSTQRNLEILESYGNHIIQPAEGELASGLEGKGRMQEPEVIIDFIRSLKKDEKKGLKKTEEFSFFDKKVLITAGPTHEAIDPVRFIGNHSSGKMGYAIADAFAQFGADVTLISGPSQLEPKHKDVNVIRVTTASQMFDACSEFVDKADITVFSAAVADFTPETVADKKMKREKDDLVIKLKPTLDIAGELGKKKRSSQIFIGFALETNDGLENAKGKLERKNLDLIVLNSLEDKGAGFGTETNKITMIDKSGNIDKFELKHKQDVARDIIDKTRKLLEDA